MRHWSQAPTLGASTSSSQCLPPVWRHAVAFNVAIEFDRACAINMNYILLRADLDKAADLDRADHSNYWRSSTAPQQCRETQLLSLYAASPQPRPNEGAASQLLCSRQSCSTIPVLKVLLKSLPLDICSLEQAFQEAMRNGYTRHIDKCVSEQGKRSTQRFEGGLAMLGRCRHTLLCHYTTLITCEKIHENP